MPDDNMLNFLIDDEPDGIKEPKKPWIILVVDDDIDVHESSYVIAKRIFIKGRPLEVLSAYSAKEAIDLLARGEHVDLMFLDCVMETPRAGIDLAYYIKVERKLRIPIIVMVTGFAGTVDEANYSNYHLDAYINKLEATKEVREKILNKFLVEET